MNSLWSDYVQTSEELYTSRELRFREDNKDTWLPAIKVKNGMNILEVGCAGGLLLHRIKQFLPDVKATGLDRDDVHIEYAKAKTAKLNLDCDFVAGDATQLPFDDNTFDLTYSHTVVEHIETQPFLREQFRVLKPNGTIVVMSVRTSLNVAPENWKPTSEREKELLDKAWANSDEFIQRNKIGGYKLKESDFPVELEKAGFSDVDIQFISLVSYAPDNYTVPAELALRQINESRLANFESLKKAKRINPDALSAEEQKELEGLIDARFDDRIAKYKRGEKVWDIATSAILIASGRKR